MNMDILPTLYQIGPHELEVGFNLLRKYNMASRTWVVMFIMIYEYDRFLKWLYYKFNNVSIPV